MNGASGRLQCSQKQELDMVTLLRRVAFGVVLAAVSASAALAQTVVSQSKIAGVAAVVPNPPDPSPVVDPQGAPGSPISGTWQANIEKSNRDPNHQFQSATMQFVVVGDTVTLTYGGVNAGGQQESGTVVLQADGKEHPVPGQAGVTVATRWLGPRLLQTIGRSGGAQVGEQSYEVSTDGKTLVAKVSGMDASGRRFEQVIVFDRK
jgi:hypothetical protein